MSGFVDARIARLCAVFETDRRALCRGSCQCPRDLVFDLDVNLWQTATGMSSVLIWREPFFKIVHSTVNHNLSVNSPSGTGRPPFVGGRRARPA